MKLWHLTPHKGLNPDPWEPWYDKVFGFVIRAEHEADARAIAQDEAADEARQYMPTKDGYRIINSEVWEDPTLVKCVELTNEGPEALIIKDFHAA